MPFVVAVALCALVGALLAANALRHARRRRAVRSGVHSLLAVIFLLAAAAVWMIGASLRTYERLSHEQRAAEILLTRLGDRFFRATVTYPDHSAQTFDLRGDEWQVDARVIKWQGLATLAGFDTAYRLERLSGRYADIASERSGPRSVYDLHAEARLDAWSLARRYKRYLPWVDALYGSAAFLPMADGALYEISVSQTGLLARPLNQAARDAVGGWR
jgi:hypothetical protein